MASLTDLRDPGPTTTGTPPWGDVAARTDELLSAPDVLVVGAGVAGLAVAAAARAAGLGSVQVVDRGPIAAGATSRNAGALIPDVHALAVDEDEAALGRRGLALHRLFAEEHGTPLHPLTWLAVTASAPSDDRLRASRATWLPDAAAVADATAGHLQADQGVLVPDQATTDPIALAAALAAQVPRVCTGVEVHDVEPGSRPQVATSAGTLTPGTVVVATGTVPSSWLTTRRRWVTGHLALTTPTSLPRDLGAGGPIVLVPRCDGRLLVGGTRDGEADGRIDEQVVATVRDALAVLAPAAADVDFEQVWTGQRPVVDDDLPVIDDIAEHVLVVGGLYHTGVLTCLAIAEGVVARLRDDHWPAWVRPFHRRG